MVTGPVSDMCCIPWKTSSDGLKPDIVDQCRRHTALNSYSMGSVDSDSAGSQFSFLPFVAFGALLHRFATAREDSTRGIQIEERRPPRFTGFPINTFRRS